MSRRRHDVGDRRMSRHAVTVVRLGRRVYLTVVVSHHRRRGDRRRRRRRGKGAGATASTLELIIPDTVVVTAAIVRRGERQSRRHRGRRELSIVVEDVMLAVAEVLVVTVAVLRVVRGVLPVMVTVVILRRRAGGVTLRNVRRRGSDVRPMRLDHHRVSVSFCHAAGNLHAAVLSAVAKIVFATTIQFSERIRSRPKKTNEKSDNTR